jgi:hypothetical protein
VYTTVLEKAADHLCRQVAREKALPQRLRKVGHRIDFYVLSDSVHVVVLQFLRDCCRFLLDQITALVNLFSSLSPVPQEPTHRLIDCRL